MAMLVGQGFGGGVIERGNVDREGRSRKQLAIPSEPYELALSVDNAIDNFARADVELVADVPSVFCQLPLHQAVPFFGSVTALICERR
jgi:hypothetical protein